MQMRVNDKIVYNEMGNLIRSDTVINLIVYFQNTLKLGSNLELLKVSQKAIFDAKEILKKNIYFFKMSFISEADNTMENIFSLIRGIVDKVQSFKINCCRTSFCSNLSACFNKRFFHTGK